MTDIEKLIETIFSAIDEVNPLLPEEKRLEKSINTVLFGRRGRLDSLGLVTLIVAIEQKIEEEFQETLTLADEKAISQKNSPFKTVGTLVEYITLLLKKNSNE